MPDDKVPVPVIVPAWHRIVHYPDNHLNDFCIFRDRDGVWHAIGIMGTGTWASEQSLFHASSPSLDQPFERHAPLFTENPSGDLAPQKHAPFVIERDGTYFLYYRRPPGTIMLVQTENPWQWHGLGDELFTERDARDVCILEHEGRFLMYYCQSAEVDGELRVCVMVRTSTDLIAWSDGRIAHYDAPAKHSFLESPFVIKRPEGFYLIECHRMIGRRISVVVLSEDPFHFPTGRDNWLTVLAPAHAPEIIDDGEQLHIAAVSGPVDPGYPPPKDGGWVDIAPLVWK